MKRDKDSELQAFFRACEKNGIKVSKIPLPEDKRGRTIIVEASEDEQILQADNSAITTSIDATGRKIGITAASPSRAKLMKKIMQAQKRRNASEGNRHTGTQRVKSKEFPSLLL